MDQNSEYRQELLQEYKQTAMPFLRYLPWFESHAGRPGGNYYKGPEFTENTMSFPVYDSTLLQFVREASKSSLMDRNYPYVYTRYRIKTPEDERRVIEAVELKDWDILRAILSKYVLGGMTKGTLWSQAVEENIFYLVLKQMQKIIEYWDRPLELK